MLSLSERTASSFIMFLLTEVIFIEFLSMHPSPAMYPARQPSMHSFGELRMISGMCLCRAYLPVFRMLMKRS